MKMQRPMTTLERGFTLVEMVVVITITGIIAATVAVFLRAPVQGYFDALQLADLTDTADTAMRRIARDLHQALPNSVRVTGANQALEFLSTRAGGRYRAELGTGSEDILDFTQPGDQTFDLIGAPMSFASGDQIVIYNLGIPGSDAYAGNTLASHNRRAYSGTVGSAVSNVQISSANAFPFDSPAHRFQVVDTPVSYICSGGTLTRYWGYAIAASQPNPPSGGSSAVLAKNVSSCTFSYAAGVTQRTGLVSIQIAVTQNTETVQIVNEVHVNNVP
jgi:MSHA biogenesis protein MshO